jgi:hypothetical protein
MKMRCECLQLADHRRAIFIFGKAMSCDGNKLFREFDSSWRFC